MDNTEYVMAVLCAPLTGLDLQRTERANNVVIMRMLEYDNTVGYFSNDHFAANLIESPIRMMFVFGQQDIIIIRTPEDKREIYRRLNISMPDTPLC